MPCVTNPRVIRRAFELLVCVEILQELDVKAAFLVVQIEGVLAPVWLVLGRVDLDVVFPLFLFLKASFFRGFLAPSRDALSIDYAVVFGALVIISSCGALLRTIVSNNLKLIGLRRERFSILSRQQLPIGKILALQFHTCVHKL